MKIAFTSFTRLYAIEAQSVSVKLQAFTEVSQVSPAQLNLKIRTTHIVKPVKLGEST